METRFIAVMNQKGGVGKTTLTVNLGAALAQLGKEVLLIDLDPQGNLSIHLNVNIHELNFSIYHVLVENTDLADVVHYHIQPRLSLVPANIDLSGAEVELVNEVGRETLLKDALEMYLQDRPCDFVIFDCPPSLGLLSLNALSAATEVFIPIQTEFFALQGLAKLLGVIELVKKRLNKNLSLSNVIPTLYDMRTNLSKEVLSDIQNHFGKIVTRTLIRKNVKLAEAPSHGQTIFEYAPKSNGSKDFFALSKELALPAEEETPEEVTAEEETLEEVTAEEQTPEEEVVEQEVTSQKQHEIEEMAAGAVTEMQEDFKRFHQLKNPPRQSDDNSNTYNNNANNFLTAYSKKARKRMRRVRLKINNNK